jgi:hypothetical protein
MMPSVALTPESSERPMVSASVPGAGAVAPQHNWYRPVSGGRVRPDRYRPGLPAHLAVRQRHQSLLLAADGVFARDDYPGRQAPLEKTAAARAAARCAPPVLGGCDLTPKAPPVVAILYLLDPRIA